MRLAVGDEQAGTRLDALLAERLGSRSRAQRLIDAGRVTVDGEVREVLPFLDLVRVNNDGIAFGAFGGGQALVIVALVAALCGLIVFFVLHGERRGIWLATGLLLGGALGNIIDRVRDGAVTDFLKLPHWPAFNVADIAVTVGVILLVFVLERK